MIQYPLKQEFKNSNILIQNNICCLHQFNFGVGKPIFIIPPHAGRHPNIAQKMIDLCIKHNKTVYALEILPVNYKNNKTTINDLIEFIHICCDYIHYSVDLIGLCQGAWLSAIYTALYPENINRYCNFAGPINTKTGQPNIIENYCKYASIDYHKFLVAIFNNKQSGFLQWLSFAMVDPTFVFVKRWIDLYNFIIDEDYDNIYKWFKNNSWYDSPQDLAGNWFLDCLENHFINNKLYNGTWKILDQYVKLNNIKCPVYLFAGDDDKITHPQQVFDMGNKTTGFVKKTLFKNAGHTKVFTGKNELNTFSNLFLKG